MADKNTIVFADGRKIEGLDELANIAAGSHMKILINEDKLVLVKYQPHQMLAVMTMLLMINKMPQRNNMPDASE